MKGQNSPKLGMIGCESVEQLSAFRRLGCLSAAKGSISKTHQMS